MAIFRRRSKGDSTEESEAPPTEGDQQEAEEATGPAASTVAGGYDRGNGPWDIAELDDRAEQGITRFDLGSLLVPMLPGLSLQVEVDQSNNVVAVTAMREDGAVNIQGLAAPKSGGLWAEYRQELTAELGGAGHTITEHEGPFGTELRTLLPATAPDGTDVWRPLRFIGIDGPRWFLKVVFMGRPAVEPDFGDELHHVVRETVVVRGGDAMAPRDLLPMRLPEAVHDDHELHDVEDSEVGPELADEDDGFINPFERGPEITEIR